MTFEGGNEATYVYDRTGKGLGEVVIKDQFGNVITPDEGELTVAYVGVNNGYFSTEKPVNVGTYNVEAVYVGTDADNEISLGVAVGTVEITRAALTIAPTDMSKYVGEEDPELTYETIGLFEGDEITVELVRAEGEEAGEYDITVALVHGETLRNYEVEREVGTFSILKRDNSWTSELTIEDSVYDGTAKTATAESAYGDVVITYYADEECTEEIEAPVNAGTYYVKAVVAEAGEYKGLEATASFTIAKATNEWTTPLAIADWKEGETPATPVAAAKDGEVTFKYYSDAECTTEISVPTTVGTYYVKAFVSETANYNALESEAVEFTVLVSTTIEQVMEELGLQEIGDLTGNKAYVRGFTVEDSVENLITKMESIEGAELVSFRNDAGEEIVTGIVSTGMEFTLRIGNVEYDRIMVIMGDTNGDGHIWATDYMTIKRQIMNDKTYLYDEYALAADIDDNGKIWATDYTAIKNHIMEVKEIEQKTGDY